MYKTRLHRSEGEWHTSCYVDAIRLTPSQMPFIIVSFCEMSPSMKHWRGKWSDFHHPDIHSLEGKDIASHVSS